MSTCPRRCDDGKTIFTFSRRPTTFQKAQNSCKQNGTTLARNLDVSSYAALLNCCSAGPSSYWIGLQNVAASKCDNRNSPGFQWIGSRTCSDGSPLNIKASHINNEECMAMTIHSKPSDTNRNVPSARVEPCHNNNIYYVCQTAKRNRSPKGRTRMKKNATTSIISLKNSVSVTSTTTTTLNDSTFNATKISIISPTEKTGSDSDFNVWVTFGFLAVFFFLLFLAAFFLYRRQNNRFLSKKITCCHEKKNKNNAVDKTYNKWVFVIMQNINNTT